MSLAPLKQKGPIFGKSHTERKRKAMLVHKYKGTVESWNNSFGTSLCVLRCMHVIAYCVALSGFGGVARRKRVAYKKRKWTGLQQRTRAVRKPNPDNATQ